MNNFDHTFVSDKDYSPKVTTYTSKKLDSGVWYALTIAPSDQKQFFYSKERGADFKRYYYSVLKTLSHSTDLFMNLEVSDNTPDSSNPNRLHFHGVIRFSPLGIAKWYMYNRNKLLKFNMICIKPISSAQNWFNYIFKDHEFNKLLSDYYDLPIPFFSTEKALSLFKTENKILT